MHLDYTSSKSLPEGPIEVTIEESILLALENNRSLHVERYNPLIVQTFEDRERAVFDPVLSGGATGFREKGRQRSRTSSGELFDITSNRTEVDLGLSQFLPTGTEVDVDLSTNRTWADLFNDLHATRAGLTVTQALLRGFGIDVNLASLRQARLDTLVSQYELRGFSESLLALVEEIYWDYALAQRQIEIFTVSLKLAEQQLRETEERIKIGKLAEIELAAAQSEVALRQEALINARSTLATTRLRLLRLLNPPGTNLWNREIVLMDKPVVPDVRLDDVESHVQVALRMRPDLNQARLELQRGDMEIVKTRNGLLPKLDLFITLGKTGFADSFGDSVRDFGGNSYDISASLRVEYPLGNREAYARHKRATFTRKQVEEAMENLTQLVQVDVRSAYIQVNRAREQVVATGATRKFQEEKVRAETEKFRVGRSTTLLVAQAQRDLVASQISEIEAVVDYLKALVNLYRLDGSLLERRGIKAPGREPVDLSIEKW
ncbi:MAG: TolC family protein [Deltaproteobacteria bacterium]|nr:TolC family protein [Deltaproteobacteria bacterium]